MGKKSEDMLPYKQQKKKPGEKRQEVIMKQSL